MSTTLSKEAPSPIERAILVAGSQTELAQLLGVSSNAVYQWRKKLKPIPVARAIEIEHACCGKVSRRELRPDVQWDEIAPPRVRRRAALQ